MPDFKQRLVAGGPLLWLDHFDYSARLLAGGSAPWLEPAAAVAWLRSAQSLLRSDVLGLPLGAIATRWLGAQAAARERMGARSRVTFPLKSLLAEAELRALLVELAAAARASFPDLVLALSCPSPRSWLTDAFQAAHGAAPVDAVDEDAIDAAAVYQADFLRSFAGSQIDALLLVEPSRDPAPPLELYQPVFNVAAYYRWTFGVELPDADCPEPGAARVDFLLAPRACPGVATGIIVPESFWQNAEEAAPDITTAFRYARIPAAAEPEAVLDRLTRLRTGRFGVGSC